MFKCISIKLDDDDFDNRKWQIPTPGESPYQLRGGERRQAGSHEAGQADGHLRLLHGEDVRGARELGLRLGHDGSQSCHQVTLLGGVAAAGRPGSYFHNYQPSYPGVSSVYGTGMQTPAQYMASSYSSPSYVGPYDRWVYSVSAGY